MNVYSLKIFTINNNQILCSNKLVYLLVDDNKNQQVGDNIEDKHEVVNIRQICSQFVIIIPETQFNRLVCEIPGIRSGVCWCHLCAKSVKRRIHNVKLSDGT